MSSEVVKSAATLRRSAIAERIRLREEWSALKETNNDNGTRENNVLVKKAKNMVRSNDNYTNKYDIHNRENITGFQVNEVLRGVVVFVDIGSETRALALRAALVALGASVMPAWSPLVTHVVWSQGGCTKTRAKARALACRVVSPLWVESCAGSARRLPEKMFPALTRPSDIPSPATLKKMLKKIDQENIPLNILESEEERPRLRISTDTSVSDTSHDTSHDKSGDTTNRYTNKENNVNTKRRQVMSVISEIPKKSRRQLFTQKEAELLENGNETDDQTPRKSIKMTQENKKKLAQAERTARKLVGTRKAVKPVKNNAPRIVLTGMSNRKRQEMFSSIHKLNGVIQRQVNRRTTHVILGSSQDQETDEQTQMTNIPNIERALEDMFRDIIVTEDVSGIDILDGPNEQEAQDRLNESNIANKDAPRTVNALLGAARGCRVLQEQWVVNSVKCNKWLPHFGYEVPHLLKISQKARIERLALEKMKSEYAYDVFNGMRVRVSENAEKKDGVTQLLTLCGAVIGDGGKKQNVTQVTQTVKRTQRSQKVQSKVQNTQTEEEIEITIGREIGQISSRWVFDSISAARPRTTRRYINK